MVVVIELERCVTGAGVFCIVIGKFSHWKEHCLVVLFKVDKGSELGFHSAVLPFGLTACLRVEHS